MTKPTCPWCGRRFEPKTVGAHRKRFCSATCKDRYHAALRKWAERAVANGQLSVADLKSTQSSCTTGE